MAVRLRDVALAAGVSTATVSLALSGNPRISAETAARVVEVADRLGYRPHAGARSLRTDSTGSLGLVVGDVANPFFAELAGEIQRAAARAGFSIVLCNCDEDAARQDEYVRSLLAGRQVDGIILVPTAALTPGLRMAGAARERVVFLDRPLEVAGDGEAERHLAGCPVVRCSPVRAFADTAALLYDLGHRRVGVIAPPLETLIGRERRDMLLGALAAAGIAADGVRVVAGDFRQDSGQRAIAGLLDAGGGPPPTAVVALGGPMAIGAMKGLRAAGLRVPAEISLVGFDDAPWFELFDPPLTAIAQPVAALAGAAVRSMVELLSGGPAEAAEPIDVRPACRLVRRGSCAPPPVVAADR
ncbi:MAG TPA: LacI family DNA-binding transcriptional regulator [Streptosporangiaceae bacterium]|jgi:LacI family transcriptional regulator